MTSCCDQKGCDLERTPRDQARVLWIVLAINLIMFFVELASGLYAKSVSLTGDSLDMLGDAVAYGSSLYVVNMGVAAKSRSARLKGGIILISAVFVLATAVYRTFFQVLPRVPVMGVVGTLALVMNVICLALLTRRRHDDVNMRAVWLCSRNDIIANISVLAAAGLVALLGTPWPDLLVGLALCVLFLRSAAAIFSASRAAVDRAGAVPTT